MTVKQALKFGHNALKDSITTSLTDSKVLLAHALSVEREQLPLRLNQIMTDGQFKKYQNFLSERQQNIPIAYIVGYKEFFNIPFYVDKRVLIPRPETEILVEKAIAELEKHPAKDSLLIDIGTGSGNIAISVARNVPLLKVIATDVSKAAVDVAKRNSRTFEADKQISFRVGSLLEPIKQTEIEGKHVILAANLPYVPSRYNVDKDLHYEPQEAIFGGESGTELYEEFMSQLVKLCFTDLLGLFEIHYDQAKELTRLIKEAFPKAGITIHKDYASYDRLVEVRVKPE